VNNGGFGSIDWGFGKKDYITQSDLKRIEGVILKKNDNLENLFILSKMYMGYMTEKEFEGE